ncbi:MAG TPA: holo-ACP synthase [Ramlibacter sp.]|nr:holo-ACP synthase [Ramlibacter sp.]
MFKRDREESWPETPWEMRLGFDLVQVSQVADSITRFGDSYENRIFTAGEREYANRGEAVRAERFAARLAAKEAVIKALKLSEAGIAWSDIEVFKLPDGDCEVHLHGRTAELADGMGVMQMLLSLSHDGDYAGAVVTALLARQPTPMATT